MPLPQQLTDDPSVEGVLGVFEYALAELHKTFEQARLFENEAQNRESLLQETLEKLRTTSTSLEKMQHKY